MNGDVKTKIIKRNGEEVTFDLDKIINAITKANEEVTKIHQMNQYQIMAIAEKVADQVANSSHAVNVEDIQNMVETGIMEMRGYEVAQKYVRYRFKRELRRKSNTTDDGILSLLDNINEEVNQENSNKNPVINSTQRDYMAGEVSKDLSKRVLLPNEIIRAHEEGIIHFHDSDYFAQREHNCDLINLEDMLQNGTVISETLIEKPHSFFTACNVTTQIVAQVASNQYGGQSFTLAHLAPFVDISRKKLRKNVVKERKVIGESMDDAIIDKITEMRLYDEIKQGIQTIQYQLVTLMTCNGQAPFVTVFMYLDEVPEGQTRDDLALVIEEVLKQRIQGVKNEKGVWITPAFPKLIYALDDDNITPDSKYWHLTELAAKCTAKRMVPDYISAKVMRELKNGEVYPCMGCRSFLTVEDSQRNADGSHKFYGRFNQGVVTINLVDVACSSNGHSIYIISDEPYREIAYDGFEVPYVPHFYNNTLVAYSFSKSLSLPGERIGYIVAPNEAEDFEQLLPAFIASARLLSYVCVPTLYQKVVGECVDLTSDLSIYQKNKDLFYNALVDMGYECVEPGGAFYLFPKALEEDANAFCEKAKEYDLLIVPGDSFGCPGYVRISYCVPTERIEKALPLFKKLIDDYRK